MFPLLNMALSWRVPLAGMLWCLMDLCSARSWKWWCSEQGLGHQGPQLMSEVLQGVVEEKAVNLPHSAFRELPLVMVPYYGTMS